MTVTIGVHASNPSLFYLSRLDHAQRELAALGETVVWHAYSDGVATGRLLAEGTLDFGGTGSTPPITAQAAGHDIVYTAVSAPRPNHGALLVAGDSPAQSVADLRGGVVVLGIGSWQTHFIAKALHQNGLSYGADIAPQRPDGANAAELTRRLVAGEIAGWVAQGAQLHAALRSGEVRVLLRAGDVIADRSVFFTRRDLAETRPELLAALTRAIAATDEWVRDHLDEAASIAAAEIGGSAADWRAALADLPWATEPVTDAFIAEQQEAADILRAAGFLSADVTVADAVARPAEQAAR